MYVCMYLRQILALWPWLSHRALNNYIVKIHPNASENENTICQIRPIVGVCFII